MAHDAKVGKGNERYGDRHDTDVADNENEPGKSARRCLLPIMSVFIAHFRAQNTLAYLHKSK
jgi:hypothetical protein